MRRLATLALFLAACGGGGGGGGGSDPPPPPPPVEKPQTLWPLTAGSRWVYDIVDPLRGSFQKVVEVVGEEPVPESTARAIRVRDSEPTQDEWSWQSDGGVFVTRIREEDRRNGIVIRVTTFTPGMPKSVSAVVPAGWVERVSVTETTRRPDGTTTSVPKTFEWRLVALSERVTVPAGTFDAMKVARQRVDQPDEPVRTYWLAAGVGKVKEESRERTEELASYAVK